MNIKNKKGMTLVELIVYMALAALLLAPVIFLVHNSSLNMTRDAVSTELSMTGRDVLGIFFDDLKNTGFKINPDFTTNMAVTYNTTPATRPYKDSSSFWVKNNQSGPEDANKNKAYDSLAIIKGKLNATGGWDGIDIVSYYVSGVNLMRRVGSGTAQTIAQNVEALQFQFAEEDMVWDNANEYDHASETGAALDSLVKYKSRVKFIKIIFVLKDDKKVGAVQQAPAIVLGNDPVAYTLSAGSPNTPFLREKYEITVPVPNNGLFPDSSLP